MGDRLQAELVLEYPFTRTTGPVVGAFLTGVREGVLLGIKRPDGTVLCPPTEYDPETSAELNELVEVGPGGVVTTWTWVAKARPHQPWDRPYALAMILLDGADTPMMHGVLVEDVEHMSTGMRVTVSFKDEREGHIADILGFVPETSTTTESANG